MTANEKVAQRKLSMLQLAKELRSVSEACRLMGYSRSQFYEIKRAFQTGGLEAVLDVWLHHYNYERPHRGYRNQGRKPY